MIRLTADTFFVTFIGFLIFQKIELVVGNSILFFVISIALKSHKSIFKYDMIFYLRNLVFSLLCSNSFSGLFVSFRYFDNAAFGEVLLSISSSFLVISLYHIFVAFYYQKAKAFLRMSQHSARDTPTFILGCGDRASFIAAGLVLDEIDFIGFLTNEPASFYNRKYGHQILPISDLEKYKKCRIIVADEQLPKKFKVDLIQRGHELEIRKYEHEILGNTNDDIIKKLGWGHSKPNPMDCGHIKDQVVLITGAAGSIGSEIVRQVIEYGAKKIIAVDRDEYRLYSLIEELHGDVDQLEIALLDVLNEVQLEEIFKLHRPDIVFHAAAYKHVPILEINRLNAFMNNVVSTYNLVRLAQNYGVARFVLISTDKAVRPTSFMGATKRVAELLVTSPKNGIKTRFCAVRFGNVIGSSGSVVPKFQKQITSGGPLTVTHPDMERYFMTIPHAVKLVLGAADLGREGEIFLFDMGQARKIVDVANQMIKLNGKSVGNKKNQIQIVFSGLRPGEKLYEELLIDAEASKTEIPEIYMAYEHKYNDEKLNSIIKNVLIEPYTKQEAEIEKIVQSLVPEYRSS